MRWVAALFVSLFLACASTPDERIVVVPEHTHAVHPCECTCKVDSGDYSLPHIVPYEED